MLNPDVRGWGAWARTKIHSSKGWCAAIALRPNDAHDFNTQKAKLAIALKKTPRLVGIISADRANAQV